MISELGIIIGYFNHWRQFAHLKTKHIHSIFVFKSPMTSCHQITYGLQKWSFTKVILKAMNHGKREVVYQTNRQRYGVTPK